MTNIVWVGNPFFYDRLAKFGCAVSFLPVTPGNILGWADILKANNGATPDAVIVADMSLPPFVLGLEDFPCLTIFYAIDTHIHSWFPFYAQAFDLCLVSLKDHLSKFKGMRLKDEQIIWMPPFAPDLEGPLPPVTGEWNLLFAGRVDRAVNPARVDFMEALAALLPDLRLASGNFAELFPKAKLALNHSIDNDLNFRVFEAPGLGACLLTPRVGHGLEELFTDRRDLYIYDQSNLPGLATLVRELLDKPAEVAQTRANGLAVIDAHHRASHRAKFVARLVQDLHAPGQGRQTKQPGQQTGQAAELVRARRAGKQALHEAYLRFLYLLHAESQQIPALRRAYLHAAQTPAQL